MIWSKERGILLELLSSNSIAFSICTIIWAAHRFNRNHNGNRVVKRHSTQLYNYSILSGVQRQFATDDAIKRVLLSLFVEGGTEYLRNSSWTFIYDSSSSCRLCKLAGEFYCSAWNRRCKTNVLCLWKSVETTQIRLEQLRVLAARHV